MLDPVGVAAALALAWAAAEDVGRRIIPDEVPAALALLAVIRDALSSSPSSSALAAALAIAVFVTLLGLHRRGWLGGGDVKLASALVFLAGPDNAGALALVTALAGGVLSLAYLAGGAVARRLGLVRRLLRRLGPRRHARWWGRVLIEESRRLATGHSIPYGVALAGGGLAVLVRP